MRDSFIFYRSFFEAIKNLPRENQLNIFNAISELSLNNKEIELEGIEKTIFILIKPQLEANNKKFENGKKGGRKNQKETKIEPKQNQKETKIEANVNDNVNVNDNKNDNKKEYNQFLVSVCKTLRKHIISKKNINIPDKQLLNWYEDIRKLKDIDLKNRNNAESDIENCIELIKNFDGNEYFPVIESGKSFREKFFKIEDYAKRNKPKQYIEPDVDSMIYNENEN